jgi:hypothetical protein
MSGVVITEYPTGNILTLAAFVAAHSLTADVIETRDGHWYARLDAYIPASYSSAEKRPVSRRLLSTKQVKTQVLAQTELAAQLTAMSTLELEDGTKLDISAIRVTP